MRTHSYFRRLPALGLKLRFKLFFPIKMDPLNLESLIGHPNIQTEITTLYKILAEGTGVARKKNVEKIFFGFF